ncbi:MAG TPA: hypothetical protein VFG69_12250, partial [Nannocystaceae bacterium]|nr:hypothetical protein [Nannocystaceae bacterium]
APCRGTGIVKTRRRSPALANAAQRHFATALAIHRAATVELPLELHSAYADAVGLAMVRVVDPELEALGRTTAAPPFAGGRDLAPATGRAATSADERAAARWMAYAAHVAERYAAVERSGSPHFAVAATQRSALAWEHAAGALVGTSKRERPAAVCTALDALRVSASTSARTSYEHCVQRAVESQIDGPAVALCEAALAQLGSDLVVPMHEIVGVSEYTEARMESVGVITDPIPTPAARSARSR